jgi:hypothetical protein
LGVKKTPFGTANIPGREIPSGGKTWRFIPVDFTANLEYVKTQLRFIKIFSRIILFLWRRHPPGSGKFWATGFASCDGSDIINYQYTPHRNQMTRPPLSINSLGAIAGQALAQDQDADVWGMTSRGVFIHLSAGWVIFLSFEQFRGPLTLNSDLSPITFRDLRTGMQVRICKCALNFEDLSIEIVTHHALLWSPPARNLVPLSSLAGRIARARFIYQKVCAAHEDCLFRDLLSNSEIAPNQEMPRDNSGNISHDIFRITARLAKCLGLGAGLTPAGDDLVLGYLLAINRWGDLLCPDLNISEINQTLRQAAYRKTNTLSANLIECASSGQADERLVLALDGVLTGHPDPDACAAALLAWGHSSGANALIGMTWAIAPAIALNTIIKGSFLPLDR